MNKALVHARSNAVGPIRHEVRNGHNVMIVPSYVIKDDTILNGIFYGKDEIDKSFEGLNGTHAPLGHPQKDGMFLNAADPVAVAENGVFAFNENARRVDDRIAIDVVIYKDRAAENANGQRLLEAINKGEPIHTSTGLYMNIEDAPEGHAAEKIGRNFVWDHNALLLDEPGAITPDEGVGLMVNKSGLTVINSRVDWAEDDLAWAAEHLLDSAERLDKAKAREALLPRLVEALRGIMSGGSAEANENVQEENVMDDATKKAFEAVNKNFEAMPEMIANAIATAVKPIADAQEAQANAAKEAEEAERESLTNTIVKAAILDEDDCKALPVANLRKLAENAKPGKAAPVGNGLGDPDPNDTIKFRVPGAAKEA
ncbi:hypothetical protein [Sulfitobacter sp. 1A13679]|uniref:hypothetical protein n=1 Tax=Sulfitobacter sp. 1A13679 TaxID=3368597 RepID=UPI003746889F